MSAPVAVVVEQCWHRVPGGTALSALRAIEAVEHRGSVHQIGVSALHRTPPRAGFRPKIPVRSMRLPRRALYDSWHFLRWPDVESATGRVSVVHATGMAIPPRRRAPLVVTVHDLAWRQEPGWFTPRGVRFFERSLSLTRRDADVVVCPSQFTASEAEMAGIPRDRIRVIPWGVHPADPHSDLGARVRRAWRLERPYLLWVGTVEPRKNLAGLVGAFSLLGRDDLDLVLAGPSGWKQALGPMIAGSERVRALGYVPEDDLGGLYREAEAFCFPSHHEGFGMPALEAMAQGTPVVTTAGSATAEVVGDGGVLVDGTGAAAIAQGIAEALDRRDELSRSARRRAASFPWSRTGELLTSLYEEVAA